MEVLYIILGWLFGILSPGITNRISDYYKKIYLQRIIISELKDLKKRLVLLPYNIRSNYGAFDEELLAWTIKQEVEEFKSFTDAYENMNSKNKGDSKIFLNYCNTLKLRENPAFHFKKMSTSTIDSNLMNFGILDNKFLEKLLEIKFQINAFNEEIQIVYDYLKMTFDSNITEANHNIITKEIDGKNLLIAEKAIYIVEKINNIICLEKQN